jgi:hypothetical protein
MREVTENMTTFGDAIRQIERVLDDTEYPATYQELQVLNRTLKMMCTHHRNHRIPQHKPAVVELPGAGLFPTAVFQYMRQIERRRQMHSTACACSC